MGVCQSYQTARQASRRRNTQVSSFHQHMHQADGGLLIDIVLHFLYQIIGDDHYLLL